MYLMVVFDGLCGFLSLSDSPKYSESTSSYFANQVNKAVNK